MLVQKLFHPIVAWFSLAVSYIYIFDCCNNSLFTCSQKTSRPIEIARFESKTIIVNTLKSNPFALIFLLYLEPKHSKEP